MSVVLTIIQWVQPSLFTAVCTTNNFTSYLLSILYNYIDVHLLALHSQVFTSATTVTNNSINRTPTVAPNTVLTVPEIGVYIEYEMDFLNKYNYVYKRDSLSHL